MELTPGQALTEVICDRVLLPRFQTTNKEKPFGWAGTFQYGGLLGGTGLPHELFKRSFSAAVLGSAAVLVHGADLIVSASGRSLSPVAVAQLTAVTLAMVCERAGE